MLTTLDNREAWEQEVEWSGVFTAKSEILKLKTSNPIQQDKPSE